MNLQTQSFAVAAKWIFFFNKRDEKRQLEREKYQTNIPTNATEKQTNKQTKNLMYKTKCIPVFEFLINPIW